MHVNNITHRYLCDLHLRQYAILRKYVQTHKLFLVNITNGHQKMILLCSQIYETSLQHYDQWRSQYGFISYTAYRTLEPKLCSISSRVVSVSSTVSCRSAACNTSRSVIFASLLNICATPGEQIYFKIMKKMFQNFQNH